MCRVATAWYVTSWTSSTCHQHARHWIGILCNLLVCSLQLWEASDWTICLNYPNTCSSKWTSHNYRNCKGSQFLNITCSTDNRHVRVHHHLPVHLCCRCGLPVLNITLKKFGRSQHSPCHHACLLCTILTMLASLNHGATHPWREF